MTVLQKEEKEHIKVEKKTRKRKHKKIIKKRSERNANKK